MSKTYLNKYENGRSQTQHARDRANGLAHQSRVREYFDDVEEDCRHSSPVVMTIPPAKPNGGKSTTMVQMMLFDQPVAVRASAPAAASVAGSNQRREAPVVSPTRARLAAAGPRPRTQEFTLSGVVRGCGLGLATAAAVLLAYLVIT